MSLKVGRPEISFLSQLMLLTTAAVLAVKPTKACWAHSYALLACPANPIKFSLHKTP
jgi:hypothetical protein